MTDQTAEMMTIEQIDEELQAIEARRAALAAEQSNLTAVLGSTWKEPEKTAEMQAQLTGIGALFEGLTHRQVTLQANRLEAERAAALADYDRLTGEWVKTYQDEDEIKAKRQRLQELDAQLVKQLEPISERRQIASGRRARIQKQLDKLGVPSAVLQEIYMKYQ